MNSFWYFLLHLPQAINIIQNNDTANGVTTTVYAISSLWWRASSFPEQKDKSNSFGSPNQSRAQDTLMLESPKECGKRQNINDVAWTVNLCLIPIKITCVLAWDALSELVIPLKSRHKELRPQRAREPPKVEWKRQPSPNRSIDFFVFFLHFRAYLLIQLESNENKLYNIYGEKQLKLKIIILQFTGV